MTEGGLPIAGDKRSVPKQVFAKLFQHAVTPPESLLELPFTQSNSVTAKSFVSMLVGPLVCPHVPG